MEPSYALYHTAWQPHTWGRKLWSPIRQSVLHQRAFIWTALRILAILGCSWVIPEGLEVLWFQAASVWPSFVPRHCCTEPQTALLGLRGGTTSQEVEKNLKENSGLCIKAVQNIIQPPCENNHRKNVCICFGVKSWHLHSHCQFEKYKQISVQIRQKKLLNFDHIKKNKYPTNKQRWPHNLHSLFLCFNQTWYRKTCYMHLLLLCISGVLPHPSLS